MFKFVRVGSDPLPKFLLPKFTQSYALTDLIGKGTFGKVYEGCRREFAGYSFERVAVKIVDLTPGKSVDVLETERQAQSERLLLSGFRHVSVSVTVSRQFSLLIVFLFQANIVSIIDSFRCLSTACIVLEFLAGGIYSCGTGHPCSTSWTKREPSKSYSCRLCWLLPTFIRKGLCIVT